MAMTAAEKMKAQQELPEVKKVKTDFNNINLSKEQFEIKLRRERAIDARMEAEKIKIEKEIELEEKTIEKARLKALKEAEKNQEEV